jgi:hypothetical protein
VKQENWNYTYIYCVDIERWASLYAGQGRLFPTIFFGPRVRRNPFRYTGDGSLFYMRFSFSLKSKGRDRTHYSRINGYAFPFHWDPFLCWDAQKETEDLFLILKIGYDDLDRHLPRAVIIGLLFIPGFVGQHPPCIILHVSHSTVCIQKLKMSLKKKEKTF